MHFSLCDFLMDVVQNSVEAGASEVHVTWEEKSGSLKMTVSDNGCGMTPEELERAQDPFYTNGVKHKSRKVGLGIPFLKQTLEMTEGIFRIQSRKGKGTVLEAVFNTDHVDNPPVGDFMGAFFSCLTLEGDHEMVIHRIFHEEDQDNDYSLKRSELIEALGDLTDAANLGLLKQFILSQEGEN